MELNLDDIYILEGNNHVKTLELKWRGYSMEGVQIFSVLPNGDYLPLSDLTISKLIIKTK